MRALRHGGTASPVQDAHEPRAGREDDVPAPRTPALERDVIGVVPGREAEKPLDSPPLVARGYPRLEPEARLAGCGPGEGVLHQDASDAEETPSQSCRCRARR